MDNLLTQGKAVPMIVVVPEAHALTLEPTQKNPIKTTVGKIDTILMMLAEGVRRLLLCGQIPGTYRGESLCDIEHQTRPVLPEQAQSEKSQGVRGTESPDPINQTLKKTEKLVFVFLEGSTGYQGRKPLASEELER
jgi:hypothetical protein